MVLKNEKSQTGLSTFGNRKCISPVICVRQSWEVVREKLVNMYPEQIIDLLWKAKIVGFLIPEPLFPTAESSLKPSQRRISLPMLALWFINNV
jgi:hypothetical protein